MLQKTGKAMLALKRMANLSNRSDGSDSRSSHVDGIKGAQCVQYKHSSACLLQTLMAHRCLGLFSFPDTGLGMEAQEAVMALEQQLRSKPNFPQTLQDLKEPCGATVHMACIVQGNVNPHAFYA